MGGEEEDGGLDDDRARMFEVDFEGGGKKTGVNREDIVDIQGFAFLCPQTAVPIEPGCCR